MVFLDSTGCRDDIIDYELGMLLPSSLLSVLLTGIRAVNCRLGDTSGSNQALARSIPLAQQFCDVISSDVLEGNFSISLLTTCRYPCKLFLLRNCRYPEAGQSPNFVQFSQLQPRDEVIPSGGTPAPPRHHRCHRRRSRQPIQPVQPAQPLEPRVPRHRPCYSTLASASGSFLPANSPAVPSPKVILNWHLPFPVVVLRAAFALVAPLPFLTINLFVHLHRVLCFALSFVVLRDAHPAPPLPMFVDHSHTGCITAAPWKHLLASPSARCKSVASGSSSPQSWYEIGNVTWSYMAPWLLFAGFSQPIE